MKTPLPPILFLLALAGCSGEAPAPSATTGAAPESATAAERSDPTARARLGIVFTDNDPWMAGAVIEEGHIRVGDQLLLRTDNGAHIPVTITAIRDDATQTDVSDASAPRGVFLSFRPKPSYAIGDLGYEPLLLGDPALLQYQQTRPD